MSGITTHVLDTALGRPAPGIRVTLAAAEGGGWTLVAEDRTDADGRARLTDSAHRLGRGDYQLTFEVGEYMTRRATSSFYPRVVVHFVVEDPKEHHHVPLLLSPYGYSTYRGT